MRSLGQKGKKALTKSSRLFDFMMWWKMFLVFTMVAMLSCHRREVKAHEGFSSIGRYRSVLNRIGQHIRHRSVHSRSRNEERRDVCTELSWLPSLVEEEEKKAKLGKGSCYNCDIVVRQSAAWSSRYWHENISPSLFRKRKKSRSRRSLNWSSDCPNFYHELACSKKKTCWHDDLSNDQQKPWTALPVGSDFASQTFVDFIPCSDSEFSRGSRSPITLNSPEKHSDRAAPSSHKSIMQRLNDSRFESGCRKASAKLNYVVAAALTCEKSSLEDTQCRAVNDREWNLILCKFAQTISEKSLSQERSLEHNGDLSLDHKQTKNGSAEECDSRRLAI